MFVLRGCCCAETVLSRPLLLTYFGVFFSVDINPLSLDRCVGALLGGALSFKFQSRHVCVCAHVPVWLGVVPLGCSVGQVPAVDWKKERALV